MGTIRSSHTIVGRTYNLHTLGHLPQATFNVSIDHCAGARFLLLLVLARFEVVFMPRTNQAQQGPTKGAVSAVNLI
ncbi:MAG: hypothetical protein QMB08_08585 [Acidimicrobiales bacterium]